ncbi:hypothetical protein CIN_08110 [Commensalibacter intestini A911]|uniref:CinA C-terminal domain-containing protein n=2 Tax=Commensalibacter intestini TaxID=479936 RepID=A0A251ZXN6_9PROT|nr:CinA family protein [Commensalibacter intestini]EHD14879.1 hypothetical protein CIN_08110 [Commensalibacter intestini A911]OUI79412.1 hypothetical protein HK18_02295 [Commensalibacter intestini]
MNVNDLKQHLFSLCLELADFCQAHDLKLVTAESCTAGLISGYLTDLPGSSSYIEGGFVTYSNYMKATMLGVNQANLDKYGAVSKQVALEMVSGALNKAFHANIAVAVTGFAGPDTHDLVGLVWIAIQRRDRKAIAYQYNFLGDREVIRLQTVIEAIKLLLTLS